jgi:hypothetical protein
MCIRTGQICPGLPEGPLFVDMTGIARYGMQKRKSKQSTESTNLTTQTWMCPDNTTIHRISQRATVTEAFYERFLTYFTFEGEGKDIRNRLTWLYHLPLLSTDGTNAALVLAVEATATAYCAVESADLALRRYSWSLYGEALQTHGRFVSRSRSKDEVTVHMVSTSVLFSFFEAMQATNADAYRSHIYGAAKMLEVTGPGQCTQGVLCQIYYHLRTQMTFIHLTGNGNQTPVEVRRILYGTLEYKKLPMFQRLMSHVSTLSEMYVASSFGATQQSLDLATYIKVESEVDSLWHEYADPTANIGPQPLWKEAPTGTVQFRDAFTALTIAYFSSARILLGIIARRLATPLLDLTDHYTTILQASQFLQTYTIGCAYMRMATPLLLVALHSPRPSQQRRATGCFERWIRKSMTVISALALESIYQQRASEKQLSVLVLETYGTISSNFDSNSTLTFDTSTSTVGIAVD